MTEQMDERHSRILDIVSNESKVPVGELAKKLGISEVTIRKDLSLLESKGLLQREHGFATMVKSDDVSNRLSFNYNAKRAIAARAANDIQDGETIMIESGSCCALLAEAIAKIRRDVTIVTNSVFIASFIRQYAQAKLILLGGEFQRESQVMVGPLIRKCVEEFYVNKIFIGTDGFNDIGAMSGDLMRAEAVRSMAVNAKRVIILTESKKFSQGGVVSLVPYNRIDTIYTDNRAPSNKLDTLKSMNINVVTTALSIDRAVN